MNRKVLLVVIITFLSFLAGVGYIYLKPKLFPSKPNPELETPSPKPLITISGKLHFGGSLYPPKKNCPDELFLETEPGLSAIKGLALVLIKIPDQNTEVTAGKLYAGYNNRQVQLTGYFEPAPPDADPQDTPCCEEPSITIFHISPLDKAEPDLKANTGIITLTGEVVCLPEQKPSQPDSEGCTLGLKDKRYPGYFALMNLPPETTLAEKQLVQATGSLNPELSSYYRDIRTVYVFDFQIL